MSAKILIGVDEPDIVSMLESFLTDENLSLMLVSISAVATSVLSIFPTDNRELSTKSLIFL